jgi:phage-related minor tail protein
MTTTNTNIVLTDIEDALQALNSVLPTILTVVGTFVPQVAAFAKFAPLIGILISGVHTVAQVTGQDASTAAATVAQHLTPGEPNAPALS